MLIKIYLELNKAFSGCNGNIFFYCVNIDYFSERNIFYAYNGIVIIAGITKSGKNKILFGVSLIFVF